MLKLLKKYPILSICLFIAFMLLPNLEVLQVSIMEARNFVTAREMLDNNHWILTTMNGVARYQKPPLPAWFSAFSGLLFGVKNLFAMRLPAVLMVMLASSVMYCFSKIILKEKTHSMINALVLASSFYVVGIAFEAPSDIIAHALMLVAIYYLFIIFKSEKTSYKYTITAGLFLGFSILAKGPIAIYALLFPFLIAYGFSFKYKNTKQKLPYILGTLLLGLVIGGSWYLYVKSQDSQVLQTIVNKEASNWKSYNVRPFYYYWSFFTQSGIWTIPAFISLLYPYLKKRVINTKAYKLSFIWTISAVILLSLIPMKKSRYLMPVLIPLAFNIGFYINYLIRTFKTLKDRRETLPVYFNFGLIGLLSIAFPIALFTMFKTELQTCIFRFSLASIVLITIGIALLFHLKNKNIKNVFLLTVFFFASLFIFILPLSEVFKNKDFKPFHNLNKENKQRNIKLYSINNTVPEAVWDYGNSIPQIKKENDTYLFPKDSILGIITNKMSPKEETEIRAKYIMKKIITYDLNLFSSASNQNNPRLKNTFYILEKKN